MAADQLSPSGGRPRDRPTTKRDARSAEVDMPRVRQRRREPSDAGC